MEFDESTFCKLAQKMSTKQLMVFTQAVRTSLIEAGLETKLVEGALKQAIKTVRANNTLEVECSKLFTNSANQQGKENRGIDSIGRILVEHCFFRSQETKMVWPEGSDQDNTSRETFTEGVIPRPLMRYFLISVRGTIPQLNKFEAGSVLFGEENIEHEKRKQYVEEVIAEFKDSQSAKINWEKVYEDQRFQKLSLDLIGDIRRKVEQFGLERYLKILDNLHQRDPERSSINNMSRPFSLEDVKQIDEALWAAEGALAQNIQ